MSQIRAVNATEILDSRGNPTVQVQIETSDGFISRAAVPSGASTGEKEAVELRDGDVKRYQGKGVLKAVQHVRGPLAEILVGQSVFEQRRLDIQMIRADGTENKRRLGANAILGASLALARAGAFAAELELYQYLGGTNAHMLPCPMMNIINGGAHADNSLDFQEFMIRPHGAPSFSDAVRWGAEIFHTLKALLHDAGHLTAVGDEGGFAPNLASHEEALDLIMKAIEKAGYKPGEQVSLALDCAASEFYDKNTKTYLGKTYHELTAYLKGLSEKYPIDSIEDPLDENDWEGWEYFSREMNGLVQVVGDDLFVTNPKYLKQGIEKGIANSILIKLNQIGTVTETLDTISLAQSYGYTTVVSHRSGETEDSFIADVAVGMNTGQEFKTGSLSRTDRVVKYNRLLSIEQQLAETGVFRDSVRKCC